MKIIRMRLAHPATGGFLAVFVGHGMGRFAYPALMPAMVRHHWITSPQVGYIGTANLAGYVLGALYGIRGKANTAHVAPAMLAVAISFFACAFPYGFAWLFSWRLAAGIAGGIILTTVLPIVQQCADPATRSKAVASTFAAVGLGIMLTGATVPRLLNRGVGFTSGVIAGASFMMAALGWYAWQTKAFAIAPNTFDEADRTTDRNRVVLLGFSYATAAIAYVPYVIFWVDYIARGLGAGMREAGLCWMLFGIASAAGPFLSAKLADRIGAVRAFRWTLLANGIAVILPLVSSHLGFIVVSSMGGGAMAMGVSTLASMRVREISTPATQQRLWAAMTIVFAVAFATGGWAFSYLFATTHQHTGTFLWSGIALATGVVAQCVERERACRRREEEVSSNVA